MAFFLVGLGTARPVRATGLNIRKNRLVKSQVASAAALSCAQPVRIMPLGDSITQGSSSGEADPTKQISYRKELWDKLVSAGYDVDFVGSQVWGDFYQPQGFDPDNEGHAGWRDDQIATHIYNNGGENWLSNFPADVILLHIGTNNLNSSASDVANILNEVDQYEAAQQREVWVILARIINRSCSLNNPACAEAATTTTFNDNVQAMAQARINNGDKILLVNMETGAGINYRLQPSGDMWDNLHPYATGYNKMAGKWEEVLNDLLLPDANDDNITIMEDSGTTTIFPLSNDSGFNLSIQGWQPETNPSTVGTVVFDSVNQNFKYTPPPDFLGQDSFTYQVVSCPGGMDAIAKITIDVTPASDLPSISAIADQVTLEDTSTGPISFTIGDAGTPADNLALSASSGDPAVVPDGNITFSGSGSTRTLTVKPAVDRNTPANPVTITIKVRDADNHESSTSFKLTITPVDDSPVITNPGSHAWVAGESVSLQITASDPDGDPLSYSAGGLPAGVSIDKNNGLISGELAANSAGEYPVEVTVTSGKKTASVSFSVKVNAVRYRYIFPLLFK